MSGLGRGVAVVTKHGNPDRDCERQGGRLLRVNRRAKFMHGDVLALRDLMQQAPGEAVDAEAGAAVANPYVAADKAGGQCLGGKLFHLPPRGLNARSATRELCARIFARGLMARFRRGAVGLTGAAGISRRTRAARAIVGAT